MDIIQVQLVSSEAFVVFSNSKDIEKALNLGKKVIGEIPIKIHRSSKEQMQFHCGSVTNQWFEVTSKNLKNNVGKKVLSCLFVLVVFVLKIFNLIGSPNIDSPHQASRPTYSIVTRGFPWTTSKSDIKKFFKGVRIINGEQGIQMAKNGCAIEANFMVNNEDDVQKALAFNGQKFESKTIYGNAISIETMEFEEVHFIVFFFSSSFLVLKMDSEEQNDNVRQQLNDASPQQLRKYLQN